MTSKKQQARAYFHYSF